MSIKKKNKKSELDKLEQYLKKKKIKYERIDKDFEYEHDLLNEPFLNKFDKHQIKVLDDAGEVVWDAICHYGSYGYEQGLLEVMGEEILGHDDVEGWLTAREVIDMYERRAG